MFTIKVDIDGLVTKFDTLADGAADLEKPLAVFGGYLRRRALERYKGQAFAPLAASTIEKRAQKGLHRLERKLQRDVRRAMGRARKARNAAPRGFLQRLLDQSQSRAIDDAISVGTRGVQNRLAVLGAFQASHDRMKFKDRIEARQLSFKQNISLLQREARSVMKAVNQPILGGLPRTLVVVVEGASVTLRSATHEKWSAAHNEGATVGKGAQLPQRETVKLEQADLEVFGSILKSHLLLPFQEGLQGPGF